MYVYGVVERDRCVVLCIWGQHVHMQKPEEDIGGPALLLIHLSQGISLDLKFTIRLGWPARELMGPTVSTSNVIHRHLWPRSVLFFNVVAGDSIPGPHVCATNSPNH